MERAKVGEVFKYYAKPKVAAIRLTDGPLKVGDKIQIQGYTTDLTVSVDSMEIENQKVENASVGQEIGILIGDRARPGDRVYRLME